MYQLERTVALASKEELKNENESTHSVLPFPDLFHAVDVERCGARLLIGVFDTLIINKMQRAFGAVAKG